MVMMEWTKALECPRCHARGLTLHAASNDELLPERGDPACNHCGSRFPIRDHILDMTQPNDSELLTIAGLSNYLPFLPWGYENIWRPRSLTLLSGEDFSVERELKLLNDWLAVQPCELVIDLGSSTDWYARGVAKSEPNGSAVSIVAIDMSVGMLRTGRAYACRDGVKNIAHIRVPAQRLPFADASVDALMCGGSLNEFRSMGEALREARRVCKPSGRLFAMSLLKSISLGGQFGQWNAHLSGISFPALDQFNETLKASGWQVERQRVFGVVGCTLMKPDENSQI